MNTQVLPLSNRHVIVTRPKEFSSPLIDRVRAAGGHALSMPMFDLLETDHPEELTAALARLPAFDLVIFVSPTAIERALPRIIAVGIPPNVEFAAIGEASAERLARFGIQKVLRPTEQSDSEGLLALPALQNVAGKRIAIFRGNDGRELLAETLQSRGALVEYIECYRRQPLSPDFQTLRVLWSMGECPIVVITSTEAINYFLKPVNDTDEFNLQTKTAFVVSHERIKETAEKFGARYIKTKATNDAALYDGIIEIAKELKTIPPTQTSSFLQERAHQEKEQKGEATSLSTRIDAKKGQPSLAVWLILGVASTAFAAGLYLHQEVEQLRLQFGRQLDARKIEVRSLQQQTEALKQENRQLSQRVAQIQETGGGGAPIIAPLPSEGHEIWFLLEVEQTLLATSQQLQLSGNTTQAIFILSGLDARLARLPVSPQLTRVRAALAQDLLKLKAQAPLDMAGLTARLDALLGQVEQLPLTVSAERSVPQTPVYPSGMSFWERFGLELKQDINSLVQIRRLDHPDVLLLTPQQVFLLQEHLKLRLLGARIALLQRDQRRFNTDLDACQQALNRHFDLRTPQTKTFLEALVALRNTVVTVQGTDLGYSLKAISQFKELGGGKR